MEIKSTKDFQEVCLEKAKKCFQEQTGYTFEGEKISVVWCCKTLQNNKALLSTTVSDGMYYEITNNGDKNEMYFDAYKKWKNICIKF